MEWLAVFALWQERHALELQVIGITFANATAVTDMISSLEVAPNFPIFVDATCQLEARLSVNALPLAFICGTNGIIRWQGCPFTPEYDTLNEHVLDQIMSFDEGVLNARSKRAIAAAEQEEKKKGKKK